MAEDDTQYGVAVSDEDACTTLGAEQLLKLLQVAGGITASSATLASIICARH